MKQKINNMKRKTVLIDMDGVICDYTQKMLDLAVTGFGLPQYSAKEVLFFETEKIFSQEYQEKVERLSLEENFFLSLEPLPGAIEAIKEMLTDSNFDVWICSSPKKTGETCHSEKFLWLRKYFGQKFAEKLILTRDKTLVYGDYLIDDKSDVYGVNEEPFWEHIIFDPPYNRESRGKKRMDWSNWKEVLRGAN